MRNKYSIFQKILIYQDPFLLHGKHRVGEDAQETCLQVLSHPHLLISWRSPAFQGHSQHSSVSIPWEFPLRMCKRKHFSRGYMIGPPSSLPSFPASFPLSFHKYIYWAPTVEPGLALSEDVIVNKMQSSRSWQLKNCRQVKKPFRLVWEALTRRERLSSDCPQVMCTGAFVFWPEIP